VGLATEQGLSTGRERLVDPALRPRRGVLVDHRPQVGLAVEGVAQLQAFRSRDELLHECVPDLLVYEHPLYADADLAGVCEGADEDTADGPVEVGRLVDDHPGVAAELEDHLLLARALLHPPAHRRAAGEAEELEAVVADHLVAELAAHRQGHHTAPPARPPPRWHTHASA